MQTRYLRGDQVLELLARIVSGAAAWFLADRMGSVRNVMDNSGAVIDTISYDGYGNVTNETSPANGGQYKYDGYRFDSETGLYRPDPSIARYYAPPTGLWMGQDPLRLVPDSNPYRYVWNNPTNANDPSALQDEPSPILRPESRSCIRTYEPPPRLDFDFLKPQECCVTDKLKVKKGLVQD